MRVLPLLYITLLLSGLPIVGTPLQAQAPSDVSGVYTAVIRPALHITSRKKKQARLYVHQTDNFYLYGCLDIYEGRRGGDVEQSVLFIGRPMVQYGPGRVTDAEGHHVVGYRFTLPFVPDPKPSIRNGPPRPATIEGTLERTPKGTRIEVFGFDGVYTDEGGLEAIQSDIDALARLTLHRAFVRHSPRGAGRYTSLVNQTYGRRGAFTVLVDTAALARPLDVETLDVYYIAEGGIPSLTPSERTQEDFERAKEAIATLFKRTMGTAWMAPADRLKQKDIHYFLHFLPRLRTLNVYEQHWSKGFGKTPQLIFDVERYTDTAQYRTIDLSLAASPIDAVAASTFDKADIDRAHALAERDQQRADYIASEGMDTLRRQRYEAAYAEDEAIRTAALQHGYVYKNWEFWLFKTPEFMQDGLVGAIRQAAAGLVNETVRHDTFGGMLYTLQLRAVFNGQFEKTQVNWPFRMMYNAMVVYLDELYPSFLPDDSPTQRFSSTTTTRAINGLGVQVGSDASTSYTTVRVHPDLAEHYAMYLRADRTGQGIERWGPVSDKPHPVLMREVMRRMLVAFPPGTAAFEQLYENMKRFAAGRPSLQAEGVPLQHPASQAQDPLHSADKQALTRCYEQNGFTADIFVLCSCMQRKATDMASSDPTTWKSTYADSYAAFHYDYARSCAP